METYSRNKDGRYVVKLPLSASASSLGGSMARAKACLQRMKKKINSSDGFGQLYLDFMNEYFTLNHMEKVPRDELNKKPSFYLPHHGVLRMESLTTKLRVVFNGSAPTTSGQSLNDIMYVGPNLLLNIVDVITWLRSHKFVLSTDITKMYRQILVYPEDRNLQRIIWSDKQNQEVHYRLNTVTYGTRAAPFLAIRTLLQLVEDEGNKYPLAVESLTKGRYVDDIFGGAETLNQLEAKADQLENL